MKWLDEGYNLPEWYEELKANPGRKAVLHEGVNPLQSANYQTRYKKLPNIKVKAQPGDGMFELDIIVWYEEDKDA